MSVARSTANPGQRSTSVCTGPLWRPLHSDPKQTVDALESGHSSQPPATRNLPFDFQRCYSCLISSFEVGAVTGCQWQSRSADSGLLSVEEAAGQERTQEKLAQSIN